VPLPRPLGAVVLAAGLGKRMHSRRAKVLHELAGRPLVCHVLAALVPLEPDRVALVRLSKGPPHVLLTDHLDGDRPILIYRVADLETALADLKARGWKKGHSLEIPMGPCCSFTTPGGHRIAVYELSRPEVANHFMGRRDF